MSLADSSLKKTSSTSFLICALLIAKFSFASYTEIIATRESLRLAKLRYKSGITTQREVVNNQRDLTDSEVRYIISVTSYNTLLADLSRQTGLDNIKPCDIKVNQQNQSDIDSKSLYESNLIPLCQL